MKPLDRRAVPRRPAWVGVLLCAGSALAAEAGGIYTCIDANGRRLTSDRYIQACSDREQRQLNRDGSLKAIVPPTLTHDQRAALEARRFQEELERQARRDAVKRDRNLMNRFPTEAAHQKARAKALDDVHGGIVLSERRLAALAAERRPLLDEAEFYVGKPLPLKLRQLLDANDAATEAQRALIENAQAEVVRINANYDAELAHLRKLWAGAPPGSIGPVPTESPTVGVRRTTVR